MKSEDGGVTGRVNQNKKKCMKSLMKTQYWIS